MLSLIGLPPLAGFFGKLYMFMEALDQSTSRPGRLTLLWLVALGLMNSVISAFYYVRVLKAMFLRVAERDTPPLAPPGRPIAASIVLATIVVLGFGIYPTPLLEAAQSMAMPMLSDGGRTGRERMTNVPSPGRPQTPQPEGTIRAIGGPAGGIGPTPPNPTPPAVNRAPGGGRGAGPAGAGKGATKGLRKGQAAPKGEAAPKKAETKS
jgi:NADH-quinone oxidoreductase subunit N